MRYLILIFMMFLTACGSGVGRNNTIHATQFTVRCGKNIYKSDIGFVSNQGDFKDATNQHDLPQVDIYDSMSNGDYYASDDKSCYFSIQNGIVNEVGSTYCDPNDPFQHC